MRSKSCHGNSDEVVRPLNSKMTVWRQSVADDPEALEGLEEDEAKEDDVDDMEDPDVEVGSAVCRSPTAGNCLAMRDVVSSSAVSTGHCCVVL